MPGPSAPMPSTTPRRVRARRGEGDRLRADILAAAERLLIEAGDQSAISIRAIADTVGVTPPSIYLHFADRNDLIFAVCEEQFSHLHEAMDKAVQGISDPWERIARRGRAYIEFGLANAEQYRIIMTSRADLAPERLVDKRLLQTSAFARFVEDAQAAIDAGEIRGQDDALLVATALWTVAHGITSLLIAKPDFPWPPVDELVDHIFGVYAAGLGVEHPANTAQK
jgi:AcrR family transcriptional regulator